MEVSGIVGYNRGGGEDPRPSKNHWGSPSTEDHLSGGLKVVGVDKRTREGGVKRTFRTEATASTVKEAEAEEVKAEVEVAVEAVTVSAAGRWREEVEEGWGRKEEVGGTGGLQGRRRGVSELLRVVQHLIAVFPIAVIFLVLLLIQSIPPSLSSFLVLVIPFVLLFFN